MTKNVTTSILGLTVIAALLTGCSAGAADVTPTVAPTATSAPSAPAVGEVVEAGVSLAENQKAFQMADNSLVVVQSDQPLPAPVVAEMAGHLPAMSVSGSRAIEAIYYFGPEMSELTGKHVVVVATTYGSELPDGPRRWIWGVYNTDITGWATDVREEAIAKAEQWVAGQPNPELYEVVASPQPER